MKRDIVLEATLVAKYAAVEPVLDERSRRRWAAAESLAIGYGGDAVVSSATGLARETIRCRPITALSPYGAGKRKTPHPDPNHLRYANELK